MTMEGARVKESFGQRKEGTPTCGTCQCVRLTTVGTTAPSPRVVVVVARDSGKPFKPSPPTYWYHYQVFRAVPNGVGLLFSNEAAMRLRWHLKFEQRSKK